MITSKVPARSPQKTFDNIYNFAFQPASGNFEIDPTTNQFIIPINTKTLYLIERINFSCSLDNPTFYSSSDDIKFQFYLKNEPLFNKPNLVLLDELPKRLEIFTAESTRNIRVVLSGQFKQIPVLVGITNIFLFCTVELTEVTNNQYLKDYWGSQYE